MTTPPSFLPQRPDLGQSPKRGSAFVPTLIVLLCALLLVGGSAFGYVSTCGNNAQSSANTMFGYGIFIGAAVFCAAALWLFLIFVWYLIKG
jgi:uncharacterized membrane protein